jgi:hypothetical protein
MSGTHPPDDMTNSTIQVRHSGIHKHLTTVTITRDTHPSKDMTIRCWEGPSRRRVISTGA